MVSLIKHGLEESCKLALIEFTRNVFWIYIVSDKYYIKLTVGGGSSSLKNESSCCQLYKTIFLISSLMLWQDRLECLSDLDVQWTRL